MCRTWWLPTLAISAPLIAGSLLLAGGKRPQPNQAPAQTQTFTKNGRLKVLTGPELDHLPPTIGQQQHRRAGRDQPMTQPTTELRTARSSSP